MPDKEVHGRNNFPAEAEVRRWIGRAAFALQSWFDSDSARFQRLESPDTTAGLRPTGATSANRAFLACMNYLAFSGGRGGEVRHVVRVCAAKLINEYYTSDTEPYRTHSAAAPNMFSDAQASLALSTSCSRYAESLLEGDVSARRNSVLVNHQRLAISLTLQVVEHGGARLDSAQPNSAFATLHALRAIDGAARAWLPSVEGNDDQNAAVRLLTSLSAEERRRHQAGSPAPGTSPVDRFTAVLRAEARSYALRQLGLHGASDPEFDPAELLSAACILQRLAGRSGRGLIVRAVEVLAERQDPDGSWRADILSASGGRVVYVSSIELALSLANLLIADLRHGDSQLLDLIMTILSRSYSLIEAGYIDRVMGEHDHGISRQIGWGNDRTRQAQTVEVWSTALALQCLIRMHRVAQMAQHDRSMQGLRVQHGIRPISRWPDLEPVLPPLMDEDALRYRLATTLDQASDPSDDRKIVAGIVDDIIRPILLSDENRPHRVASLLLYGPPGTRKTSLVKSIADALRWPLVTISPPDFLQDGIGGFEKNADALFGKLNQLRQVVILFDECEELFRRRLSVGTPEHRTQGAFITSGMLPRLQDLRERRWTLFVIATNTELEELDPAVTRPGRLDVQQRIGHPSVSAQCAHFLSRLPETRREGLKGTERTAIRSVFREHERTLTELRKPLEVERGGVREMLTKGKGQEALKKLADLRQAEDELPWVTFAIIEKLAGEFKVCKILPKALSGSLKRSLEEARSRSWA